MLPHLLTNFEIQKYYHNDPKWCLLPKRKDGVYVINLDEFKSTGTHYRVLYINGNKSYVVIILELNMFQKKFKNLKETQI